MGGLAKPTLVEKPWPKSAWAKSVTAEMSPSPLTLRSNSDRLQVTAVGKDLGRGGRWNPLGTGPVQRGRRRHRTSADDHRGPAVVPRLLGASPHARHRPGFRLRKLPDKRRLSSDHCPPTSRERTTRRARPWSPERSGHMHCFKRSCLEGLWNPPPE